MFSLMNVLHTLHKFLSHGFDIYFLGCGKNVWLWQKPPVTKMILTRRNPRKTDRDELSSIQKKNCDEPLVTKNSVTNRPDTEWFWLVRYANNNPFSTRDHWSMRWVIWNVWKKWKKCVPCKSYLAFLEECVTLTPGWFDLHAQPDHWPVDGMLKLCAGAECLSVGADLLLLHWASKTADELVQEESHHILGPFVKEGLGLGPFCEVVHHNATLCT